VQIEHDQIRLGLDEHRDNPEGVMHGRHMATARLLQRAPQEQEIRILVVDGENPQFSEVLIESDHPAGFPDPNSK
jgi:hypothetical protein